MKLALAQITIKTGDVKTNTARIKEIWSKHQAVDIVVFPELCISGYPLEDLVENKTFLEHCDVAVKDIISFSKSMSSAALVSAPIVDDKRIHNALFLIEKGKVIAKIYKTHLPNYSVFDEKRNFKPGRNNKVVTFRNKKIGLLICEDAWGFRLPEKLAATGAEILISVNASPFDIRKALKRDKLAARITSNASLDLVYLNMCCAQDGVVFDGGSFIMRKDGSYLLKPMFWKEEVVEVDTSSEENMSSAELSKEEQMYNALILGLREYVANNGFEKLLIGVSGGIDSAFVTQLAVDAVGADMITGVRMPSQYSTDHSLKDAQELCDALGVKCYVLPIHNVVHAGLDSIKEVMNVDVTQLAEENIQARMRGTLLMGMSNQTGALLLSCGNKSEYATGYATLYGDMNGGYAPIKDVYKTQVYTLAKWRNKNIPTLALQKEVGKIPEHSIYKAPSAELAPGQKDQDTLPPYDILDQILYELIELDRDPESLEEDTRFEMKTVKAVHKMLRQNEYKRKQAAIGTKISEKIWLRIDGIRSPICLGVMHDKIQKKLIVGISGASGAIYGIKLLKILKKLGIETHLVITKSGKLSIEWETDYKLDDVIALADHYYNNNDIAARIASGSFLNDGMIIAPCTVKTMSEIATGCTQSLISRAADVALKDRRKVVLMFRETPLHLGHIKSMAAVTEIGAIVMPPVVTLYNKPKSIDDMIDHTISRVLDLYGIENDLSERWEGI